MSSKAEQLTILRGFKKDDQACHIGEIFLSANKADVRKQGYQVI